VRATDGTYVSGLNPADVIRGFSLTVDLLPLEGLLQLFEIRRVLEGNAAAQSAARGPDDLAARLSDLCDRMEAGTDADPAAPVKRASDEGHRAIVDALARRDPAAATAAASAHVARTEYWLSQLQPAPEAAPLAE
jgi:DNA-binding FadR family transcriptional regulator